jgi:hypothetical protein
VSHARSTYSKHVREELVRQVKPVVADTLAGHEQPARQPALDRMEQRAGRRLRHLLQQYVHVSIHRFAQVAVPLTAPPEHCRAHGQRSAAALHDGKLRSDDDTDQG